MDHVAAMNTMTAELAAKINAANRDRIDNCPAGFDDSTPIGDTSFKRCNICGGIFWHERYDGRLGR